MHFKFRDKSIFCQCGISLLATLRTTADETHARLHVISKLAGLHPKQTSNLHENIKYICVYIFYISTHVYT